MGKTLLCVTVTARTLAELREKRDAVSDADLIELRLDSVRDPNIAGALADQSYGPICRFVSGADVAARRITAFAARIDHT